VKLNDQHIDFIEKDLQFRGLVYEPLEGEVLDHICILVEERMDSGMRFIEAYDEARKLFGGTENIQKLQSKTIQLTTHSPKIMIKTYLKIASRNLSKHRFYSLINVTGLAVGIAVCMIITLFVVDELSYDKHFKNSDRIYRVIGNHTFNNTVFNAAVTPAPLANALVSDFPEVESSFRFRNAGSIIFVKDNESFKEEDFAYADSTFAKVFGLELISGNSETALTHPQSVIINQSMAEKYFPDEAAVGMSLTSSGGTILQITGVFRDFPDNTHFHYDFLISMSSYSRANNDAWLSNNFHTYLLLEERSDPKLLEEKFQGMVEKYIGPQIKEYLGLSLDEAAVSGTKSSFELQSLTSIHLYSDLSVEIEPNGDMAYVYIFSSIAIFILLIACINFMNLSTARSASRAKEVGIRKVLGSYRSHLIKQFLTESILLTFLAIILSLVLVTLSMDFFNDLSGKNLSIPWASDLLIPIMLLGGLMLGVIAGIYPAFYLSSFKPILVLKGVFSTGSQGSFLRSSLVVIQFGITIILIVGTVTIYRQLNFIQNKNLGFDKEQVMVIHDAYLLGNQSVSLKEELKLLAMIKSASLSSFLPTSSARSDAVFFPLDNISEDSGVDMQVWGIDNDYLETMGMSILEGRNFSEEFPSDVRAIVMNQTAVKAYGFDDPIGKQVGNFFWDPATGDINRDSIITHTIIGVVEDFHYSSLRKNIGPLCFWLRNSAGYLSVRFNSQDVQDVIQQVEKKWKDVDPNQPFAYSFLDQRFSDMYFAEQKIGKLFFVFASLAIFIACLGLFALSSFTAEQRTKEIGVRKVMGATTSSIVMLLSKEFSKLVIIAFVIAVPFSIYAVQTWLSQFAYKANAGPEIYLVAGLLSFLIAWLTIGYQSVKAARSNPARSLRVE